MNNPIPLDLARAVWNSHKSGDHETFAEDMQVTLAAHLSDLAALPAVRDLVLADRREADVEVILDTINNGTWDDWIALAKAIAAALSDATNGGHWEEGDEAYNRAADAGLPRRTEWVGIYPNATRTTYGWVPADPDAALLAIVDADTLARLREVAEVTAR